jgi:hypothetical protein
MEKELNKLPMRMNRLRLNVLLLYLFTEYDAIKREEHFIKSQTLIDIIDNIERLVRALRKHIIRK